MVWGCKNYYVQSQIPYLGILLETNQQEQGTE